VTDSDLMFAGASELAGMVRSGEISARELVQTSLERIEELNPMLNAFVQVDAEGALATADAIAAGDERPFAGVPIAIKNNRPGDLFHGEATRRHRLRGAEVAAGLRAPPRLLPAALRRAALAERPLPLGTLDPDAPDPMATFTRSGLFTPFTPVFNAAVSRGSRCRCTRARTGCHSACRSSGGRPGTRSCWRLLGSWKWRSRGCNGGLHSGVRPLRRHRNVACRTCGTRLACGLSD
jgi:hypothetical protein